MVLASYHVIRDILKIIEKHDPGELRRICTKFCERYPEDEELHEMICGVDSKISGYITSGDDKVLRDIKSELNDLMNSRKMETSGGDRLWFKDRRP